MKGMKGAGSKGHRKSEEWSQLECGIFIWNVFSKCDKFSSGCGEWVHNYEQGDPVSQSVSLWLWIAREHSFSLSLSSPFYLLSLAIACSRPRGNKVKGRKEEGEKRVSGPRGLSKVTT